MMMRAMSANGDPFHRRYQGATAVVNGVRGDIDSWLLAQEADDDTRSRAALVVSELVSNAVQASPGRPFGLSARRIRSEAITLIVTNRTEKPRIPERSDWGPDDLLAPGGRGLAIVDSLCDDVAIVASATGEVTVEATLPASFG
jgi:anti-sigma regulatory factor (Ser/Thr protein kinase)